MQSCDDRSSGTKSCKGNITSSRFETNEIGWAEIYAHDHGRSQSVGDVYSLGNELTEVVGLASKEYE